MEEKPRDIFDSDLHFIHFASSLLIGLGLIMLLLGISCKLFSWGFCQVQLVPLFGSDSGVQVDMLSISLPLAMVILGSGSRLFTGFGWIICLLLNSTLVFLFVRIAWFFNVSGSSTP